MRVIYASKEAESAALQAQAASTWALSHRAEYAKMLDEVFPNDFPRIPGEWSRRMAVLEGACARHNNAPSEVAA